MLKLYEDSLFGTKFSIFSGGLDTGIDLGKFVVDTRNYSQEMNSDEKDQ